ncbi:hypothetical protein GS399_20580 [Pedobacter sp. HMF7647]|uniref:Uncharacterized protein n=2 Tax=Hufsiella arboris TaxID=2695275 RepID=A0A7K1YFL1_9SPHI|nr:hypothetical protein [Hufsiella arboris]
MSSFQTVLDKKEAKIKKRNKLQPHCHTHGPSAERPQVGGSRSKHLFSPPLAGFHDDLQNAKYLL